MIQLADVADAAGYHRLWITEHHGVRAAQASPIVMAAHLAARTDRIKIGTGAVLLPYYSPFKIAEDFLLLEALHAGRIELGFARGPGATPAAQQALTEDLARLTPRQYAEKAHLLLDYLAGNGGVEATPAGLAPPSVFMMATSPGGSTFAAQLGVGLAFGSFILPLDRALATARESLAAYRGAGGDSERAVLAVLTLCLDDGAADAERRVQDAGMRGHEVVGDARQCASRIRALASEMQVEDVLVVPSPLPTPATTRAQLVKLARALNLSPVPEVEAAEHVLA